MSERKIIPQKDADFNVMQQRLRTMADANVTQWALDAMWMTDVFDPAADHWDLKYAAWIEPLTRTPLVTSEKNAARKVYSPLISTLVKGLRVNTRLTEDQRLELGLTDYDPTRTPSEKPRSWPVVVIMPVGPGLLRLDIVDSESKRRAKPHGVHGCEIRKGILTQPPVSPEDIPHSEFATRTPCILEFDLSLRGKTVYICLRWENTRGEKGPWCEILSAIIP
jgi:hypothetical protein